MPTKSRPWCLALLLALAWPLGARASVPLEPVASGRALAVEVQSLLALRALPFPDRVAGVAKQWLGRPYLVKSLEVGDPKLTPEPLVCRLDGFDCTTLLESSLAMARALDAPQPAEAFRSELIGLRYRGGHRGGFGDRLHYMTEWWAQQGARGILRDLTPEVADLEGTAPIQFMSQHPLLYPGLANPQALAAVKAAEARLSVAPRRYLAFATFRKLAGRVEEGDLFAFVSRVAGLDVAHVGLAARSPDGVMRLLHAPQAGGVVCFSRQPLAAYAGSVAGHAGLLWARPLAPR